MYESGNNFRINKRINYIISKKKMNTWRQNRRGSETGEGEWLKAMFEDFTRKTAQNIT